MTKKVTVKVKLNRGHWEIDVLTAEPIWFFTTPEPLLTVFEIIRNGIDNIIEGEYQNLILKNKNNLVLRTNDPKKIQQLNAYTMKMKKMKSKKKK